MVSGAAKMLLPNVSGRITAKVMPGTACGVLATIPTSTDSQHRVSPNRITRATASSADSGSVRIRNPSRNASASSTPTAIA